jgi:hypothetical protein
MKPICHPPIPDAESSRPRGADSAACAAPHLIARISGSHRMTGTAHASDVVLAFLEATATALRGAPGKQAGSGIFMVKNRC